MDEIIMRRLRHLQRLEETHKADFEERFGSLDSEAMRQEVRLTDALSADWNKKNKTTHEVAPKKRLPNGWRKEHWKTQQSIAADFAGVVAKNKKEAVAALEFYEAELTALPT